MTDDIERRDFLRHGATVLGSAFAYGPSLAAANTSALTSAGEPIGEQASSDLRFAVIFEVKPSEQGRGQYLELAAALRPRLDRVDGFRSIERFASRARPGWLLSLSQWADEAGLTRWRTHPEHHAAQEKGRDGIFDDYRLRVGQVVSLEHSDASGPWRPARRTAYNDPRRRAPRFVVLASATVSDEATRSRVDAEFTRFDGVAHQDKGSAGSELFESLPSSPYRLVALSAWPGEEAASRWSRQITTALRRFTSRGVVWQVAIVEVERDYGLLCREEAPQYFGAPATPAEAVPATPELVRIPWTGTSLTLGLRHLPPRGATDVDPSKIVLFVHGSSFPSDLAAAYRFDGHSWMDDLSEAGYDVWALDFAGYGHSDRYTNPLQAPGRHDPPGRAEVCSQQLMTAILEICERRGAPAVSVIAHSWGTLAAGICTTSRPAVVSRLVLFGPVTRREPTSRSTVTEAKEPSFVYVTIEDQRNRFLGYVPRGNAPVLEERHFDEWAQTYLDSDPESRTRVPASVRVPNGPSVDIDRAWAGHFAYDPAEVVCPTLIIRGEWDSVTRNADARWLSQALTNCPLKRDVVIPRGTHVMHLETGRFDLYRSVRTFLGGSSEGEQLQSPAPSHRARGKQPR
jgi:pimeloyl-ACP methyl ester carboxylesterase/heme-degrading monooxygenase HmoA